MSASEIYSPAEDEAAFAETYRVHHQKLLRYCQYRLRDRHEAEDVMQEAFVRAWRTMPASAYGSNFYPWLRVVAGNLCTDVLRKRSRSEPVADIEPGTVDGGMDRITDDEDRALVRQALLRLNDRHREALIMREGEGLTYDQIAQRTGVTSGTVESLLWRARQALKREFTTVAGRTGAWLPLPLLLALAARVGRARHRASGALARRFPALNRAASAEPGTHALVAALATLTMVGGVVATFAVGGSHPAPAAVRTTLSTAGGTAPTPRRAAPPAASSAATTTTTERSPAAGDAATKPLPAAGSSPGPAPVGAGGIRVDDPVTVGPAAAAANRSAPVKANVGQLVVGLWPGELSTYTAHTTTQVGTATSRILAPLSPITQTKESQK